MGNAVDDSRSFRAIALKLAGAAVIIATSIMAMTSLSPRRCAAELSGAEAAIHLQPQARGTFDPACLKYTLRELMNVELRDDLPATRSGLAARRAFHH